MKWISADEIVKAATGRKLDCLKQMKKILDGDASHPSGGSPLSKVIDLEISGERDGDGCWSGCCAPLR